MAASAGPHGGRYEAQLRETARLVAAAAAPDLAYDLVWQSRSGPPQVPWLEPDINDHLAALAAGRHHRRGGQPDRVRLRPPGGASGTSTPRRWRRPKQLGLDFVRAGTPGTDPRFVTMVRELVTERTDPDGAQLRRRLGELPDVGHLRHRLLRADPSPLTSEDHHA